MRARETLLIAKREVSEAAASRWFLLTGVGFFALALALSFLGLAGADRSGLAGFDRTTASLLNLVLTFVPLVTLTLGGLAFSGDRDDGTLAMLLSQPVTRGEVFLGRYTGLLAAISSSIAIGFGSAGVVVGLLSGGDAAAFVSIAALVLLLGASTLAIGVFVSASISGRTRVLGIAFATWLFLVYLSDLGTIGLILARQLGAAQVFVLAILNPVESARVLGVLALSDRLDILGPAGLFALDTFGRTGSTLLLLSVLALLTAMPLTLGAQSFRKAVVS